MRYTSELSLHLLDAHPTAPDETRFMDLNAAEMGFFIDQAVRGLLSIGFSDADAQYVNTTLISVFNYRCAPAAAVVPASAGPQLQSICVAPDCLLSPNDTCPAYDTAVAPAVVNATLLGNYTKVANGSTYFNESVSASTASGTGTTASSATATANATSEAGRLWRNTAGSDMLGQGIAVIGALVLATLLV